MSGNTDRSRADILEEMCTIYDRYNFLQDLLSRQFPDAGPSQETVLLPSVNPRTIFREDLTQNLREEKEELKKMLQESQKTTADLSKERECLGKLVMKLNKKLTRYMPSSVVIPDLDVEVPEHCQLARNDVTKLTALVAAYEECLNEKTEDLRNATAKFEILTKTIQSVTAENDKLHARLQALRNELPVGSEQSRDVVHAARLVLEERDNLQAEVSTYVGKMQLMAHEHSTQVAELKRKLLECRAEKQKLLTDAQQQHQVYKSLQQTIDQQEDRLRKSYSEEYHRNAVQDCRKELEKLRHALDAEKHELKLQVSGLSTEKDHLALEMTETAAKVKALEGIKAALEARLKKTEKGEKKQKRLMEKVDHHKRALELELENLKKICQKLMEERPRQLETHESLERLNRDLKDESIKTNLELGALSQMLEDEQFASRRKVAKSLGKYNQARKALKTTKKEVTVLRKHLKMKDDKIKELVREFRFLGIDQ